MGQLVQEPFNGDIDDIDEQGRQESRDSLFLMAGLRVAGDSPAQQVRVRNLSTGGLMADYPAGLPQGVAVEFDVRGIGGISGIVAWSAAGRIGVAFDRDIDPMMARKPVGGGSRTPVFVKPILLPRRSR
ncbi:MAG: PilZ domain-containing protein [Sphingomonas sp.]